MAPQTSSRSNKGSRMADAIHLDQLTTRDGTLRSEPTTQRPKRSGPWKRSTNSFEGLDVDAGSDGSDDAFTISENGTASSGEDSEEVDSSDSEISNGEVVWCKKTRFGRGPEMQPNLNKSLRTKREAVVIKLATQALQHRKFTS